VKTWLGIGLFIAIGLFTAYVVGFRPQSTGPLPTDDEQTGLKERIVIKFSHVVAENTPKGLAAAHFAQLVKSMSHDRVEIQVFPNGILYSDDTEIAALQSGDIQMIAPSFSKMNAIDPAWMVMDLPFAFANQDAVNTALKGDLGRRLFATLGTHQMQGVAYWGNGFKQMTSVLRPLRVPDDFRSQTFRIQSSPVLVSQFKAFGAKTSIIPFNEVYGNLKDKSVDGQENTISNIMSKRLYLVQKYMTISNHGYLGYVVIFNKEFWDGLPADVRQMLQKALDETTVWLGKTMNTLHEQELHKLKEISGLQIHTLTADERAQWVRKLAPLYGQFRSTIGSDLMDDIGKPK
jgi:C4-dicarboxylate-binding protein DctP